MIGEYLEMRDSLWISTGGMGVRLGGDWYGELWTRWMGDRFWFVPYRTDPSRLSPNLQNHLWPKGEVGSVWVWENPAVGKVYIGREHPVTASFDILEELPATDWGMRRGESARSFYDRQIGNRRIARVYLSPHREPDPVPEPAPG